VLKQFQIPFKIWKGKGIIRVGTTKIQVKGCHTQTSEHISFLGFGIQSADYGVVVFEETREFDIETINAVLVAVRGIQNQIVIYRSNPYHINN